MKDGCSCFSRSEKKGLLNNRSQQILEEKHAQPANSYKAPLASQQPTFLQQTLTFHMCGQHVTL